MQRDARTMLVDAIASGERIVDWTRMLSREAFFADRLRQAAIEREFEIIGEALTRLRREFPEVAAKVPELREVVDFRNLLSHGYDAVDLRVVWSLAHPRRRGAPAVLRGRRLWGAGALAVPRARAGRSAGGWARAPRAGGLLASRRGEPGARRPAPGGAGGGAPCAVPVVPAPRAASGPAGGLVHGMRVSAVRPGRAHGEGTDACGWVPGGEVDLFSVPLSIEVDAIIGSA